MPLKLEDLDFRYENSPVKVIANRNFGEIKLAGLSIGPLQEGNEYSVYYWAARELAKAGIVHLREEDALDSSKLFKVQWKELGPSRWANFRVTSRFLPQAAQATASHVRGP
jgi:hypothetical protein